MQKCLTLVGLGCRLRQVISHLAGPLLQLPVLLGVVDLIAQVPHSSSEINLPYEGRMDLVQLITNPHQFPADTN